MVRMSLEKDNIQNERDTATVTTSNMEKKICELEKSLAEKEHILDLLRESASEKEEEISIKEEKIKELEKRVSKKVRAFRLYCGNGLILNMNYI